MDHMNDEDDAMRMEVRASLMTENNANIMAITDMLLSVPDEIGLYEICSDLKYDLHVSDEDEIKRITLDVVREMLRRGAFRPGGTIPKRRRTRSRRGSSASGRN